MTTTTFKLLLLLFNIKGQLVLLILTLTLKQKNVKVLHYSSNLTAAHQPQEGDR